MTCYYRRPKALPALFVMALFLAACGPLPVYYREGADVARLQTDTLSCKTRALKDAPVANEVRQRPPVYYPGGRYCSGATCWTRPGHWVEGQIYTVDVNLGLRNQLEQQCMDEKGYQKIPLKRCSQTQAASLLASRSTRLPPLTSESCVWRNADNTLDILTPQ